MKWEWRIFVSQTLINPGLQYWEDLMYQKVKERSDRYFVTEEIKYGLKYRDTEGKNFLELKIMEERKGEIEKWNKLVFPEGLKTADPLIAEIIERLLNEKQIDVRKKRKQLYFGNLFIEYTEIEIEKEIFFSFCVEGDIEEIKKYLLVNKEILDQIANENNGLIKSYPEFLLKYQ